MSRLMPDRNEMWRSAGSASTNATSTTPSWNRTGMPRQLGEVVVRGTTVRDGDEREEGRRQWAQPRLARQPGGGDDAQHHAQEAGREGECQDGRRPTGSRPRRARPDPGPRSPRDRSTARPTRPSGGASWVPVRPTLGETITPPMPTSTLSAIAPRGPVWRASSSHRLVPAASWSVGQAQGEHAEDRDRDGRADEHRDRRPRGPPYRPSRSRWAIAGGDGPDHQRRPPGGVDRRGPSTTGSGPSRRPTAPMASGERWQRLGRAGERVRVDDARRRAARTRRTRSPPASRPRSSPAGPGAAAASDVPCRSRPRAAAGRRRWRTARGSSASPAPAPRCSRRGAPGRGCGPSRRRARGWPRRPCPTRVPGWRSASAGPSGSAAAARRRRGSARTGPGRSSMSAIGTR